MVYVDYLLETPRAAPALNPPALQRQETLTAKLTKALSRKSVLFALDSSFVLNVFTKPLFSHVIHLLQQRRDNARGAGELVETWGWIVRRCFSCRHMQQVSSLDLLNRGRYRFESFRPPTSVIVKSTRSGASAVEMDKFVEDAKKLQCFNHPNVLRLHGLVVDSVPYLAVLDLTEYGDLQDLLRKARVCAVHHKFFYVA